MARFVFGWDATAERVVVSVALGPVAREVVIEDPPKAYFGTHIHLRWLKVESMFIACLAIGARPREIALVLRSRALTRAVAFQRYFILGLLAGVD